MIGIPEILIYVVIIFGSMVFHEVIHGLVSYYLGDDTAKLSNRLSLNPLRHIDPVMTILLPVTMLLLGGPVFGAAKPVLINKRKLRYGDLGMALVAIAGPLSNLFLAFFSFGVAHLAGLTSIVGQIAVLSVYVNLGFFLFNIIPIPPLDGSRVLYAILPTQAQDVMDKIEAKGMLAILVLVLFGQGVVFQYIGTGSAWIISIFAKLFGF